MKKENLKVGQIFYNYDLKEFVVSKIFNKYFECEDRWGRFVIETLKFDCPNYTQNQFQLYVSKQEILDIKERQELVSEIKKIFWGWGKINLSLEQLRKISEIIK